MKPTKTDPYQFWFFWGVRGCCVEEGYYHGLVKMPASSIYRNHLMVSLLLLFLVEFSSLLVLHFPLDSIQQ